MKTLDQLIRESREFVCESWGVGDANVLFYAPVTRFDGRTWIHPAWAREAAWSEITVRADRIWRVSGSLWNPLAFRLIWRGDAVLPVPAAGEGGRR
ncbi:MAG: hypothetical protein WCH57_12580 [Verrucomicrobiota bacterium]